MATTVSLAEFKSLAPAAYEALLTLSQAAQAGGIEASLLELVMTRVSQVNGCLFCAQMHTDAARHHGIRQRQLDQLSRWHASEEFSARDKAALTWADALSFVQHGHFDPVLMDSLQPALTRHELVLLSTCVIAIHGWNRLGIGFGWPVAPAKR